MPPYALTLEASCKGGVCQARLRVTGQFLGLTFQVWQGSLDTDLKGTCKVLHVRNQDWLLPISQLLKSNCISSFRDPCMMDAHVLHHFSAGLAFHLPIVIAKVALQHFSFKKVP